MFLFDTTMKETRARLKILKRAYSKLDQKHSIWTPPNMAWQDFNWKKYTFDLRYLWVPFPGNGAVYHDEDRMPSKFALGIDRTNSLVSIDLRYNYNKDILDSYNLPYNHTQATMVEADTSFVTLYQYKYGVPLRYALYLPNLSRTKVRTLVPYIGKILKLASDELSFTTNRYWKRDSFTWILGAYFQLNPVQVTWNNYIYLNDL